jgi:GT2 family glycosyltransferase
MVSGNTAFSALPAKVSVVIVSYNSLAHIDTCLTSVLDQTYPNYEVILSDNGSTDGSLEYIRSHFPQVEIIENKANLGYANGINAAFPHASGEFIAPLNIDTEVAPGWLAVMVTFLKENSQVGAVTPKILLFDHRTRINTMGHNIHISGLSFCRKLYQPDYDSQAPEPVSGLSGCSYLIRRATLDRMGGLPSDSFMSNDDVIVSWLLHIMGYQIYCLPEAVVYHKYRLKMDPGKMYRLEKDRLALLLATLRPLTLIVLSPVLAAVDIMTIIYSMIKGRAYLKAKMSSLAWIWHERRRISLKRKQYLKLRTVSDWHLLRRLRWDLAWGQLFHTLERRPGLEQD